MMIFLPQVEAIAEHGLAVEHSAEVGRALLVDDGGIECADNATEPLAVVPHHGCLGPVVEGEGKFLDVGVYIALAHADNRRFAHSKHPVFSEYPVVAVAKAHGVVMCINIVAIVHKICREFLEEFRRQRGEVKIQLLRINRQTGVKCTLTAPLNTAASE